jgi:BirA family biotin operon repressor/biotin-[acetyl-CoA-carboxylase] ligase
MIQKDRLSQGLLKIAPDAKLFYYDITDSTNTRAIEYIRALPEEEAIPPTVFLADSQTKGRGRRGRSFVSGEGEGIFMTLLYSPKEGEDVGRVTAKSAVSFRKALVKSAEVSPRIKWVNDLYARLPSGEEKKLAGILAEAVITDRGRVRAIAVGVGINVYLGAVTDEIRDIATSLEEVTGKRLGREEIILSLFEEFYRERDDEQTLSEYRESSVTLGKRVTVHPHSGEDYPGVAIEILDDYSLLIRKDGGETVRVFSGEVSVKPQK